MSDCTKKILFLLVVFFFSFILIANSQNVNYTYKAKVVNVVDGDTFDIDLDLGFNIWIKDFRVRLLGLDTPEPRTKNLIEKKAANLISDDLRSKVLNKNILIQSINYLDGKFGRPLVRVWLFDLEINNYLLSNKLAKLNFGKKKDKWTNDELNHIINFYEDGKVQR